MKQMYGRSSATGKLRVLFDGWPLLCQPGSPSAIHLLELFETLPFEVDAAVALPGRGGVSLPEQILRYEMPVPATLAGQLRWEQILLPGILRADHADLLHSTGWNLPVASPVPCVVSPAEMFPATGGGRGVLARLRASLRQAALSSVSAVLWPEDIPPPLAVRIPIMLLPPLTHSMFWQQQATAVSLPDSYVLAMLSQDDAGLEMAAAAWSWASAGLGEAYALLVGDTSAAAGARLREFYQAADITSLVELVDLSAPADRAAAYQQAACVLLAGPSAPWGDPLLQAMACARPIAAEETAWRDRRAGPGAYLTPPGDPRLLGAAVLTAVVEESFAEALSRAASERAAGWSKEKYQARLLDAYRQAAG